VFNLEEFMNKEFLRPRANSCKWFNKFWWCEEESIYRKWGQVQFFMWKQLSESIQCFIESIQTSETLYNRSWRLIRFKQWQNPFKISRMKI